MEKNKWSKPECVKVTLVTEEAVLATCKSNTITPGPRMTCQHDKGACKGGGS